MKRSRSNNKNFRRTAKKVSGPNRWNPMRGGIRL